MREREAVRDSGDRVSTGDPFDDCCVDETIVNPGGKRVSELASVRLEVVHDELQYGEGSWLLGKSLKPTSSWLQEGK